MEMRDFEERAKPGVPSTSRSRVENQQQTQPTYAARVGMDPGPHWGKASALNTARTLQPVIVFLLAGFCFSVSQASCRQASLI